MPQVQTVRQFSKTVREFDIKTIQQMLGTFVGGFDDEYKTILELVRKGTSGLRVKKNKVVHIPSCPDNIKDVVTHAHRLQSAIEQLELEYEKLKLVLQSFGLKEVDSWNEENNDTVASVNVTDWSGEHSATISVKNAYSIKVEQLQELKRSLGKEYDATFTEERVVSVNPKFIKQLEGMVSAVLGKKMLDEVFTRGVDIKVKSRKAYLDLLKSNAVSQETKDKLMTCVVPHKPTVKVE